MYMLIQECDQVFLHGWYADGRSHYIWADLGRCKLVHFLESYTAFKCLIVKECLSQINVELTMLC